MGKKLVEKPKCLVEKPKTLVGEKVGFKALQPCKPMRTIPPLKPWKDETAKFTKKKKRKKKRRK